MIERKAGYYMIRYAHEQAPWEPAEWDGERWVVLGNSGSFSPVTIGEIGPRIPTPDEPWQCVPVEPTQEMLRAAATSDGTDADEEIIYGMACFAWDWSLMLKAAPKP